MSDGSEKTPLEEALEGVAASARVCGNCRVWKPIMRDGEGRWTGPCRLVPHRGDLRATAPACDRFLSRDEAVPAAPPPEPTRRRSRTLVTPLRRRSGETRLQRPNVELGELTDMTRDELIDIIREALDPETDARLSPRWEGGVVVMRPGNDSQSKELPLETFFKKVVRVRDQLRVLEAKLNAHDKLSDAEKVELQQYVTRCYGSLTTFNVLFADEEDRFKGSGS